MTIKKAKGVTSGKGTPHKLEGNNGDMSVRHTRRGKKLYVKDMNNWHNINLDIDNVEIQKNVDELLKEVRRMKNRTRNNPVLDSVFFKKRGVDSVKLKNESGILKVRTQADDGDAGIQCDSIKNSTGADTIKVKAVSSVVNSLGVYGGASGNGPILTPNTAATDLDLIINPKGAGDIVINPATTKGLKITGSASTSTNYLYSTVASDGASTIKTFNNNASPTAHLTVDVHGDIELNADGGDVVFKDASASLATINGDGLTINNIGTDTAGDNYLVEVSGLVKKRTPAEVLSDIGAAASGTYLTNDAADIMVVSDFGANAALKIDADQPATAGAENSVGLWIDYDRIVAGSGTAAHNDIGINLDVTSASLGTSSLKGMDIDVIGATSGTQTAVGIDLNVSGADRHQGLNITVPDGANDYHMRLIAADDTNDYATFSVADTGDLTIKTTSNGTNASSIILNAEGSLLLDSTLGRFKFYDASDTTEYFGLTVQGGTGATSLITLSEAADGHLTLNADGGIILESSVGKFSAKNNGTEFSVASSAYAGMILGYTTIGIDSADASYAVTNSMVVVSDSHKVKFVAPPSGTVEIQVFIQADGGAGRPLRFGLSDASATTGYSPIDFPNANDTTNEHEVLQVDETDEVSVNHHWVVTGLTAGTAYEWWLAASCSHNSVYVLRWGGNVTAEYAPFIMKVTALPTAVTDYAVYG